MIDEKKLIKILSKNSIFEKITNAEGKNIFEIIKDQPQVGGWIPVSERLPNEYETVIGVTKYNYYCIAVYCKEYGFRSMDIGVEGDIIAWQPLPECWKGKRNG